jgi:protein TonB
MRRWLEVLLFLGVAGGLHLAALAQLPAPKGAESAGRAGQAVVSLEAASPDMARRVAQWDRPPDVTQERATPRTVQMPDVLPERLAAIMAAPPRPATGVGLSMPRMDAAPDADISTPAPPPPPVPEPKVRPPEDRPKARLVPTEPEPKPKAQPDSGGPPRKATRASGSGGGANAGSAKTSRAATLGNHQRQSLAAQWGAMIRRKIEGRKRYPSAARGASGTVTLRIVVEGAGARRDVSVLPRA